MDVNDLQAELGELRPDDADFDRTLPMLVAKLGQLAEGGVKAEQAGAVMPEDAIDRMRRDLFAGLVMACFEYALEHDLDAETALEERLEELRERREKQKEIKEAIESGSAEALADALGAKSNEVPTGMFDDSDSDTRGFY